MYDSTMDDRGRVKVPAAFKEYLERFPDKKLYVTSLDRRIAQVYPIVLWEQTEKFLDEYRANPKVGTRVRFNAAELGSETEMDSQGRVLFSPKLRRELDMENITPISYAQCGLYRQFHRREEDVYSNIEYLYLKRHGMKPPFRNLPNKYLV